MASVEPEIIDRLVRLAGLIEARGCRLSGVYLYGSHANGRPHAESDIDIAFVSPDYNPGSMEQWISLLRLCNEVDLRIEPVFYRPESFVDEDPLVWEIKTRGVEITLKDPP